MDSSQNERWRYESCEAKMDDLGEKTSGACETGMNGPGIALGRRKDPNLNFQGFYVLN